MAVCYKKLWKLLIDKNMNKTELRMAAGITTTALAKLGRDENVNTEVLAKICQTTARHQFDRIHGRSKPLPYREIPKVIDNRRCLFDNF